MIVITGQFYYFGQRKRSPASNSAAVLQHLRPLSTAQLNKLQPARHEICPRDLEAYRVLFHWSVISSREQSLTRLSHNVLFKYFSFCHYKDVF